MARLPRWAAEARGHWSYTGTERPSFAVAPREGERSVWDFPRPPAIEAVPQEVVVRAGEVVLARTVRCLRVLETASPPTYYIPPEDVAFEHLTSGSGGSHCEWKGEARYWDVIVPGNEAPREGWSYPDPYPEFAALRDHLAFYPTRLVCTVGEHRALPQPGGFYGGWVTPELVGPFKGEPGTEGL